MGNQNYLPINRNSTTSQRMTITQNLLNHNLTTNPQCDYWIIRDCNAMSPQIIQCKKYLWIDQKIQSSQNQKNLSQINKYYNIQTYKTISDALPSIKNQKSQFRIITSASIGQQVCDSLSSYDNINHIYIYCGYQPAGQAIKEKYSKVKFVTTVFKELLQNLEIQSRQESKYLTIPTFSKVCQGNTNINRLRYNLYGLLLMQNRKQAKQDFVKLATYFVKIQKDTHIKNFINTYPLDCQIEKIIRWYTKQSFYYKLLHNLPKISTNPEEIAYLRLPFNHLFNSIKYLYKKQKRQQFSVCRGGWMDEKQIKFIKQNEGNIIEMFGFMSANRDQAVALNFVKNVILFIRIPNKKRAEQLDYGYADISGYSDFPKQRQIVFNALNVFKVTKVEFKNGINIINLRYGQLSEIFHKYLNNQKLSSEDQAYVMNYKLQKEKIDSITSQGKIFHLLEQNQNTIKYYTNYLQFLKQKAINDSQRICQCYQGIGKAYQATGNFNKALQFYQLGANATTQLQLKAQFDFNIGLVYKEMKNYESSKIVLLKILEKIKNSSNLQLVAKCYKNIGEIYKIQQFYEKSIENYESSLKLYQSLSFSNSIKDCYLVMGQLYYKINHNQKSLQSYIIALKIHLDTYGQDHLQTPNIYYKIALCYKRLKNIQQALQFCYKSLNIFLRTNAYQHQIVDVYVSLGEIFVDKGDYIRSVDYLLKSINILISNTQQNCKKIMDIYNKIAQIYSFQKRYQKCLQYYENALKLIMIDGDNKNRVIGHVNIGQTLNKLGDYDKSLLQFQKALKVEILDEDLLIARIYKGMSQSYKNKQDLKKSITFYQLYLKFIIKKLGKNHLNVAQAYSVLAKYYQLEGQINSMLLNLQSAYKIYQQISGAQSQQATKLYNLLNQYKHN